MAENEVVEICMHCKQAAEVMIMDGPYCIKTCKACIDEYNQKIIDLRLAFFNLEEVADANKKLPN